MNTFNDKILIGRLEHIDLVDFNLTGLVAKIDSGAYNGTIHATDIKDVEHNGRPAVEFYLLDDSHPEFRQLVQRSYEFEKRYVKNSSGQSELRFFIPLVVKLGGQQLQARMSLNNRQDLRYPVLVGRKILKKKFIVDVSKTFTT